MLLWAVYGVCTLVAAGGVAYYLLVLVAARRYHREVARPAGFTVPVTILKPLAGLEDSLEDHLRSFFHQDYPQYQILFVVSGADDPAVAVVRRLLAEFPRHDAELVLAGEPPVPNAKAWSLHRAAERARYPILVVSDSDVKATPCHLRGIAADFADPQVGVVSCPYRATNSPRGMPGLWALLEALTVNTEFWCGVLVARMLEGMRFAVGPTMAVRREYLDKLGGFLATGDYLAEDFVLGQWAERHGYKTVLSAQVVEHCISCQPLRADLKGRLRWARSTRRSRPWGYVGQVFTNPLPFALPLLLGPAAPLAIAVLVTRAVVAGVVGVGLLRDPMTRRYWWLVPIADLLSLLVWAAGFFGDTVEWRGRTYRLSRDGRLAIIRP